MVILEPQDSLKNHFKIAKNHSLFVKFGIEVALGNCVDLLMFFCYLVEQIEADVVF